METIPRSTQCVQQHLSPAGHFFTEQELASGGEFAAHTRAASEPETIAPPDWAQVEADIVEFEARRAVAALRALSLRLSGPCDRCGAQSPDLIGYQYEGLCAACAVGLVEVAS